MNSNDSVAEKLCLQCGLCCNGVIFADVRLQPCDDAARLQALGLHLENKRNSCRFTQPCVAHDGCRCGVYAERPQYCREFECALLKSAQAGRIETASAVRIIRVARQRAERVRRLLRELGDTEETLALSKRFQRVRKRLEINGADEETADTFGELTLAVHGLNLLLSEAFYPGQIN
jgi:Fe-S-cluster containining protein